MKSLALPLLLSLSALVAPAWGQEAPTGRPAAGERVLAVVGGEVHTGTGTILRRGTVLCRDGKIVAVGADLKVPEGARVVDAKGRWVLPGLVAPRGDNFGIRRGRPRPGERFADCLDAENRYAELALSAGITCYHGEGPARGIYSTANAIVKPAHRAPELMVVKEPAALTINWSRATSTDRAKLEQTLAGMRKWLDGGRKGRPPGPTTLADALERKIPTRISAGAQSDIRQALRLAKRFDLKLVLVSAYEAWVLPQEVAAAGAKVVVAPRARRWPTAGRERTSGANIESCGILERAGVPFCVLPPGGFGSRGYGIGMGGVTGRDLLTYPLDAGFAVRGGASEESALRAITLTAAEALGVEDRVGSLEPGKDADIVVFQGDPMDYRNLAEVTIVSGRVLYERSKSTLFGHLPDPEKPR